MELKVCGMKHIENIQSVAELQPDYLGFIFYDKSLRNFGGIIPELPDSVKKVGVFVNASLEFVLDTIQKYDLKAVQLHGDETVEFIRELRCQFVPKTIERGQELEIIKVFSINDDFNFDVLNPFEEVVDYFLFDTKGKDRGGNGITFDWRILKKYQLETPYFLSGGIGLEQVNEIALFKKRQESRLCVTIDVNSKFEIEPGLKSVEKIKEFKKCVIANEVK